MLDTPAKRRSRRDLTVDPNVDIRGNPRAIATLRLFDTYRLLPFNWMHELVWLPEKPHVRGDYEGHRDQCTRMIRAGLLGRMTFDGHKRVDETMTYWRTARGDKFLHDKGFEGLPHDGTHDAHQVLTDLIDAQMQLGTRGTQTRFLNWQQITELDQFPTQPPQPFRFPIGKNPISGKTMHLVPDGRPFIIVNPVGENALFLKELDRNNENPQTIKNKMQNYLTCIDAIKKQYSRKQVMIVFVTTDLVRLQNLLRWAAEVNQGPSKLFLFGFIEDHVKSRRSTPEIATHLVDQPLLRAGNRPYLIKTLSEV